MQNNGGNLKNSPNSRNAVPKMQNTTVRNQNSSNNIRQSSMPAYKDAASGVGIHEDDWKMTPSGIKYRENYVGGFRSNYSGKDPMSQGYRAKKSTDVLHNTTNASNEAAVSALYNFGYMLLLISSIFFLFRGNMFKNVAIPVIIMFSLIFGMKKSLIKKGCLVNLIMYIFIIVIFLILFKI